MHRLDAAETAALLMARGADLVAIKQEIGYRLLERICALNLINSDTITALEDGRFEIMRKATPQGLDVSSNNNGGIPYLFRSNHGPVLSGEQSDERRNSTLDRADSERFEGNPTGFRTPEGI